MSLRLGSQLLISLALVKACEVLFLGSCRFFFFGYTSVGQPGREQGSLSEAASQQLHEQSHHGPLGVEQRRGVGVRARILIDGSPAGGSLNQQPADSLGHRVGLTFSVFISCTHTRRQRIKNVNF